MGRILALFSLVVLLSGCFQTVITTRVNEDGSGTVHFQTTTNLLFVGEIEKSLKKDGTVYRSKLLPDGRAQLEWNQVLVRGKNYTCKGIFTKECTYMTVLPFKVPDPSSRMMLEAAKKDGDETMILTITHIAVLPKGAKVKSTDAHDSFVDEEGINLVWKFTPSHGDLLSIIYTVGL